MFRTVIARSAVALLALASLGATEYVVAPGGSDGGPGSSAQPFATIAKGVSVARAGDTVTVRAGTYVPSGIISPAASGTSTAPITIRGEPGAVIDAKRQVPGWDWDGVIHASGRSWIVIEGLRITTSRWFGISLVNCTDVVVRNCSTYDTYASGIYVSGGSRIRVLDNRIQRACMYPGKDPAKGVQECITFGGVSDFEIAYNRVWDRLNDVSWGGEGIDCKGSCRNGRVHHNTVEDLARVGIYVDAYGGTIDGIDVYRNTVRNTWHGIVVANEVNRGVTQNVRVFDNLVRDTPRRGISIAGYEGNGPIKHVSIFNNTVVRSGGGTAWEGCGVLVEATNAANTGFVVRNNIFAGNVTQIRTSGQSFLTVDRNLIWGATATSGSNAITADPRFVDAANGDFRLAAGSPAIDAALGTPVSSTDRDDRARPVDGDGNGSAVADLGCYERPAAGLPAPWTTAAVGSPAIAGSASVDGSGRWTVVGGGSDIWNSADQFRFVSQPLTGDGMITARVVSMGNTDPWAKAGVMIRESTASGSRHAMTVMTAGNGVAFQRRTTTGAASAHTAGARAASPYWVRLERVGSTLTGWQSADGSTWSKIGSSSIALPAGVLIGLCVTSHAPGAACTAVFDNVRVVQAPAGAG